MMKHKKMNQSAKFNCPNCWGHQEYEGQEREKIEKRNNDEKDGFILAFSKNVS